VNPRSLPCVSGTRGRFEFRGATAPAAARREPRQLVLRGRGAEAMKRVASAPAAEGGARPRRVAGQRAWWVVAAVVTLCCVLCLGGAEAAKKKKVKTTFKALKCSACKAVAEEIKQEVKSERVGEPRRRHHPGACALRPHCPLWATARPSP